MTTVQSNEQHPLAAIAQLVLLADCHLLPAYGCLSHTPSDGTFSVHLSTHEDRAAWFEALCKEGQTQHDAWTSSLAEKHFIATIGPFGRVHLTVPALEATSAPQLDPALSDGLAAIANRSEQRKAATVSALLES